MAQERKAGETVTLAKGQRSPIPVGRKDDLEDVSWALSTAEAMWGRGDHSDALKWLRRAAESAAEAEADDRALELAKAAADVASLLSDRPTAVAPAPNPLTPAAPPTPVIGTQSKPPPPIPVRTNVASPTPPKVAPTTTPLPRSAQKSPTPPRVAQPAPVSKRGGRRSSPSFTDEAPPTRRGSVTNEVRKRAKSRPGPDETAPLAAAAAAKAAAAMPNAEPKAWQSLHDDDFEEDQHTRIGTPAYTESAQKASARPPPIVPAAGAPASPPAPPAAALASPPTLSAPITPGPAAAALANAPPARGVVSPGDSGSMRTSQAVRVVVWRGADGVHVAPAGTTVSAISVEALLVALDPGADLAAWLGNK